MSRLPNLAVFDSKVNFSNWNRASAMHHLPSLVSLDFLPLLTFCNGTNHCRRSNRELVDRLDVYTVTDDGFLIAFEVPENHAIPTF